MARLATLAPRLSTIKPTLPTLQAQQDSPSRKDAQGRGLYDSRKWRGSKPMSGLAWQVKRDAMFTCAMCARVHGERDLVADHIVPHRGDGRLFWDRNNLQCLCKSCHDSTKQAQDRRWPAATA